MSRRFTGEISATALQALTAATCCPSGPPRVVLAPGQLGRADYEEVNEVLTRLGGKWVSSKTKAHVFESDPSADLTAVIASRQFPADNPLDFFPTPEPLARRVAELVCEEWEHGQPFHFLEPSAGRGALLVAVLLENGVNHAVLFELNPKHVEHLRSKYSPLATVIEADFLASKPTSQTGNATHIAMNPPFTSETDGNAYMAHIRHAFDNFLAPGGVLVSVVPTGATFGTTAKHKEFRAFVEANDGEFIEVPAGSFKVSGTMVQTAILRVWKRSVK